MATKYKVDKNDFKLKVGGLIIVLLNGENKIAFMRTADKLLAIHNIKTLKMATNGSSTF